MISSARELLISVVIPTYNRGDWIAGAIESALTQDHPHVEIIVVDDGSTDTTAQKVRSFGDRVIYVHQTNQERSRARNAGIGLARGSYLAFLDSDDRWRPNHLSNLLNAFERSPNAACAIAPRLTVDENGRLLRIEGADWGGDLFGGVLFGRVSLRVSSALVRASAIKVAGGFNGDLRVGEDWEFFLRLAARFEFTASAEPTAIETVHPGRTIRNVDFVLQQRPLAVTAAFQDEDVARRAGNVLVRVRARFEQIAARDLLVAGRMAEARAHLARAIILDRSTGLTAAGLSTWLRSFAGPRASLHFEQMGCELRRRAFGKAAAPAQSRLNRLQDTPRLTTIIIDLPSRQVPAWFVGAIRRIRAEPQVRVMGQIRSEAGDHRDVRQGLVIRTYQALDRLLFPLRDNPVESVDIQAAFPDLPFERPVSAPSVILSLSPPRADQIARLASTPETRLLHCSFGRGRTANIGTTAVLQDEPTVIARVEEVSFKGQRTLSTGAFAVDAVSGRRTMNGVYWKVAQLLARDVLATAAGSDVPTEREEINAKGQDPVVGSLESNGTAGARDVLRLGRRLLRSRARERTAPATWCLGVHAHPGHPFHWADATRPEGGLFTPLVPPPGRFWADPFPVWRDGRSFVFLEEWDDRIGRGHISALELRDGKPLGEAQIVLQLPHHLSYPFLFEHRQKLFMIPESSAIRTVPIYECSRFPDRWTLVGELLSDVNAVDATLIEHEDRWWMFTSVAPENTPNIDQLSVFFADDPFGPWVPHPRNPVKTDVRSSRPAGRIFSEDGKLLRPAQDCSFSYGRAMVINQITKLSRTEYNERPVGRIEPNWIPNLVGAHTLNTAGGLTVIDGLLRVPRS